MKKICAIVSMLFACSTLNAQNNLSATPNPRNLNEASGMYAGAVAFSRVVKSSACGFALNRETPQLSVIIQRDILPLYPIESRSELYQALIGLEGDMVRQGESLYSSFYGYYTNKERMDHRTACGFVAGSAISSQKLTYEAMLRLSRQ